MPVARSVVDILPRHAAKSAAVVVRDAMDAGTVPDSPVPDAVDQALMSQPPTAGGNVVHSVAGSDGALRSFLSGRRSVHIAAQAAVCYLLAATHACGSPSMQMARVLRLLAHDGGSRAVSYALRRHAAHLPAWVWLPWVPQLVRALPRRESSGASSILVKVAELHPQVAWTQLHPFQRERPGQSEVHAARLAIRERALKVREQVKRLSIKRREEEAGGSGGSGGGSGGGAEELRAAEAEMETLTKEYEAAPRPLSSWVHAEETLSQMRSTHTSLLFELEHFAEHVHSRLRGDRAGGLLPAIGAVGERAQALAEERLGSGGSEVADGCGPVPGALVEHLARLAENVSAAPLAEAVAAWAAEHLSPRDAAWSDDAGGLCALEGASAASARIIAANPSRRTTPGRPTHLVALVARLAGVRDVLAAEYAQSAAGAAATGAAGGGWHHSLAAGLGVWLGGELLADKSSYLSELRLGRLEVPGQNEDMDPGEVPGPKDTVRIVHVEPQLDLSWSPSGFLSRRLILRGNDGRAYPFLAQPALSPLTARDVLGVQLHRCMSVALRKYASSRARRLLTRAPTVVPLHRQMRLQRDPPTLTSLHALLRRTLERQGRAPTQGIGLEALWTAFTTGATSQPAASPSSALPPTAQSAPPPSLFPLREAHEPDVVPAATPHPATDAFVQDPNLPMDWTRPPQSPADSTAERWPGSGVVASDVRRAGFAAAAQTLPATALVTELAAVYPTPEALLLFRERVAGEWAALCLVHHLMSSLPARPRSALLDLGSCGVWDGDVRPRMAAGGRLAPADAIPVPFRLTRSWQALLTPFGVDGPFAQSVTAAAAAVTRRGLWLQAYLELFFRDTLVLRATSLPSTVRAAQQWSQRTGAADADKYWDGPTSPPPLPADVDPVRMRGPAEESFLSDEDIRALDDLFAPAVELNASDVLSRADALHPHRILLAEHGAATPFHTHEDAGGVDDDEDQVTDGVRGMGTARTPSADAPCKPDTSRAATPLYRPFIPSDTSLSPGGNVLPDTSFARGVEGPPKQEGKQEEEEEGGGEGGGEGEESKEGGWDHRIPPVYRPRVFRLIAAATDNDNLANMPAAWHPWW